MGNFTIKGIMIAILIVIAIGAGAWYYFSQVHRTDIQKISGNPAAYAGKEVDIEGEVTDRTAIFGALKFYKLKDKSGEMIVVTKKSLPEAKSTVSVKGRIEDAFSLGDQKLVVFVEESVEKKTGDK
jgi:aspartyl-tRNA synthetase